jgi:hypothetical protein
MTWGCMIPRSSISDSDQALKCFTSPFDSVADKHDPYKRLRVKDRSNPWFTHELYERFHERNFAWAKARNTCLTLVRKAKSTYFLNFVSKSGVNLSIFWTNIWRKKTSIPSLPQQVMTGSGSHNRQKYTFVVLLITILPQLAIYFERLVSGNTSSSTRGSPLFTSKK